MHFRPRVASHATPRTRPRRCGQHRAPSQMPRSLVIIMQKSSSSDSSEGGECPRNVRKLLIKSREGQRDLDEDYAYKQKLGDLIFDANFEAGNLGGVAQVDEHAYDLMVRPDVSNPRHKVWFNFRVSNQRPNQCVVFNFVNLSENLALVSEAGLAPVVRSRREPNWVRLSPSQVFYYRASSLNNRRVLSIAFKFASLHDNEHQFALYFPYTLTNLEHFLCRWSTQLKRQNLSRGRKLRDQYEKARLQVATLTRSILNKPVYEISITALGDRRANEQQKPCVVVLGGVAGSCESISSLVCQGLMDFMLADDRVAALARAHLDLVVLPMLDPDSIWVGNSRTDLMGQRPMDDLALVEANPSLYRNFRQAQRRLNEIRADRPRAVTVIEIRVNPSLIGSRVIGTHFSDSLRMERHLHFPRLLSRFADGFYLEKCEFLDSRHPKTSGESYRLEVSPLGQHKRSLVEDRCEQYDQSRYLLLGKSIAYALLDLHRPKGARAADGSEHLDLFHPTSRDVDDLVLCDAA